MTFTGPTKVYVSGPHAWGPGKVHAVAGKMLWCRPNATWNPRGTQRQGDWAEVTCQSCIRSRRKGPT